MIFCSLALLLKFINLFMKIKYANLFMNKYLSIFTKAIIPTPIYMKKMKNQICHDL